MSASRWATLSFFIYFFFVFFGTSMPFQGDITDPRDISTSNPVNQFLFSFLYFVSFASLISKKDQVIRILKNEKLLSAFLFWSFLSVFWSEVPLVSFKRWVQVAGTCIICLSALVHWNSADEAMSYFKAILLIYIPLTFLSILFVPGAIQWEFPAWRGFASHKNMLGQVSLLSLFVWTYFICKQGSRKRVVAVLFWILSFVLFIGARSATAIITAGCLLLLVGSLYTERVVIRQVVGGFFSSVLFFSFYISLFLVLYFQREAIGWLFEVFGKDTTLSGRADLWACLFEESRKHLLLGCGFEGFWTINNPVMDNVFEEFVWLPTHAHMGYLDILNETGIVGISVFSLMLAFYFKNLFKLGKPHIWKWFIIAALMLNITESTLFRLNEATGVLFTFSYLALYAQLDKKEVSFT